jgi:uroporphyrinogen-III synthase
MPSNKRYRILSTKDVASALTVMAAEQHIDITTKSFIHIQPLVTDALLQRIHQLFQEKARVIFTSANAVNSIKMPDAHSPGWEIYCLEGATQDAVKTSGMHYRIVATASNAAALADKIIEEGNTTALIFFCGNKRRDELPMMLRQHNISVEEIIVYETTETPALTGNDYDGIFFLSPSAVQSFFTVNHLLQHTICFAIGNTTANTLKAYTDNKIIISTGQSMADMVQTAIFYFNNINCNE